MSKTSEQALIELREKEENQVPSTNGQAKMMTQSEYELKKRQELDQYKKDRKLNLEMVVQGVVSEIKEVNSKFGRSYLIKLDHIGKTSYYFNCHAESTVNRMFEIGKKAAFTVTKKKSKTGNEYAVIDMVYYTFA